MKKLLKYLKPYTKESILGPLFKLIEASFELLVPLVVASIITFGIERSDTSYVFKMGGVMVLLAFVGLVCAITAQYFAAKAAMGFGATIREEIFKNIQKRTFSGLEEYGTSTLITRITSDVNQLQTGVNLFLRLFLRSPFIVFGAVFMAFVVNVKGALIFTICVPILFVIVFAVLLKSIPLYKKVQRSLDNVTVKTRENLSGVRVIRAFNCDDEETEAFEKETKEKYKAEASSLKEKLKDAQKQAKQKVKDYKKQVNEEYKQRVSDIKRNYLNVHNSDELAKKKEESPM